MKFALGASQFKSIKIRKVQYHFSALKGRIIKNIPLRTFRVEMTQGTNQTNITHDEGLGKERQE